VRCADGMEVLELGWLVTLAGGRALLLFTAGCPLGMELGVSTVPGCRDDGTDTVLEDEFELNW